MSVVIRLKVPIEMHYTVIPMGTSKVNSSPNHMRNLMHADGISRYSVPPSAGPLLPLGLGKM